MEPWQMFRQTALTWGYKLLEPANAKPPRETIRWKPHT